jgi:hypothetical protein
MEGVVKVKRKLFFSRPRTLMAFEDGTIVFMKNGHIRRLLHLEWYSKITLLKCGSAFEIVTPKFREIVQSPNSDVWVNILNSLIKLNSPSAKSCKSFF